MRSNEFAAMVIGGVMGTILFFGVLLPLKRRLDRWLGRVMGIRED